ncbi:DUF3515 family protein [Corynebacterium sp. zg910]|nr:DUF3515 family protein [Corynebacterium lujinxingii]
MNRTAIAISLGLALLLVIGAVVGARIYFNQVALQPVAMTDLPAPQADSQACASLIGDLPSDLHGHPRAELAEPAPAGAAAWRSSSTERITLRCGVDIPAQYTDYAITEDIDGARWLRVDDITPQSTLATWYTVDRSPVVAVTADTEQLDGGAPVDGLDLAALEQHDQPRNPAPLTELEAADSSKCSGLLDAAPESIAEGYTRTEPAGDNTVAWHAKGRDPIVVRCGVAPSPNYGPGEQLAQVNGIPWFEDVKLANGTTASTWYALGRDSGIAASLPQAESNEAITNLTDLIAEHTAEAK